MEGGGGGKAGRGRKGLTRGLTRRREGRKKEKGREMFRFHQVKKRGFYSGEGSTWIFHCDSARGAGAPVNGIFSSEISKMGTAMANFMELSSMLSYEALGKLLYVYVKGTSTCEGYDVTKLCNVEVWHKIPD